MLERYRCGDIVRKGFLVTDINCVYLVDAHSYGVVDRFASKKEAEDSRYDLIAEISLDLAILRKTCHISPTVVNDGVSYSYYTSRVDIKTNKMSNGVTVCDLTECELKKIEDLIDLFGYEITYF